MYYKFEIQNKNSFIFEIHLLEGHAYNMCRYLLIFDIFTL
jgi:hypothetical protein